VVNIAQTNYSNWEILFEDLPDWCIPFIKIVPQFYIVGTNKSWDNTNFYSEFNYFWEKVDTTHYKLYIYLEGELFDINDDPISLYVDLSAWIVNPNDRNSVQHNLGY